MVRDFYYYILILLWLPFSVAQGENYAIIINGGGGIEHVRPSDEIDTGRIYTLLRSRDHGQAWKKENIFIYQSVGNRDEPDKLEFKFGVSVKTKQKRDFDGDGKTDVTGDASIKSIQSGFKKLHDLVKNGDQLFIFVLDHGSMKSKNPDGTLLDEAGIILWTEDLPVSLLGDMIKTLQIFAPGISTGLVMTQCFSGDFQKLAMTLENTCVMSAASATEMSWTEESGMPFCSYFIEAVRQTPSANMDDVYNHVTRNDWHAQWNDLSSARIIRALAGTGNNLRDRFSVPALGTGQWMKIRQKVSRCLPVEIPLYIQDIERLQPAIYKKQQTFKKNYAEKVDQGFEFLNDRSRLEFIQNCHQSWIEIVYLGEELGGRYWGLLDRKDLGEEDRKKIREIFNKYYIQSENRQLRGTCRRALRIHEQVTLEDMHRIARHSPQYSSFENKINACSQFKF